jgi:hypothetical protein
MDTTLYPTILSQSYAVPQEKHAVRSVVLGEPLQKMGQVNAAEFASGLDYRNKADAQWRELGRDRAELKADSNQNAIATGITGLGVGLAGYNAYETYKQAKEEEAQRKQFMNKLDLLHNIYLNNSDKVTELINGITKKYEEQAKINPAASTTPYLYGLPAMP